MSGKQQSLAVHSPELVPAFPQVKQPSSYFAPAGDEWVKEYFPPLVPEEKKEESGSALQSILMELKRTSTPPQADPEPVVLYSEPKKKKSSINYMEDLIGGMFLEIEKSSAKMIRSEEMCIDWLCGWVSSLSNRLIEHIREASELFKQNSTWSTVSKIASGILAAISIVFGLALWATPAGGPLVGGLLIASGVISILNLIMEETKAWDQVADAIAGDDIKLRNQLRIWIPASLNLASMIVGAAGSVGASLFMASFTWTQQLIMMGKLAANTGKNITEMARGVASSQSLKSQAETEHMQTQIDLVDSNLKGIIDTLQQMSGSVKRTFSSAHRSLNGYMRSTQMREIEG